MELVLAKNRDAQQVYVLDYQGGLSEVLLERNCRYVL